jgi:hypothetical protein
MSAKQKPKSKTTSETRPTHKTLPQVLPGIGDHDPRTRADFHPQFYPTANGQTAPPAEATGRNERITLEFLSVYYDLNCRYAALLEARETPERRAREEGEHLQAIEQVLIRRDALEDTYAPLGVIADPVIKDGFARDLTISFGNADTKGEPRRGLFTITAHVRLPLAPGSRFEDWNVKIERNRNA